MPGRETGLENENENDEEKEDEMSKHFYIENGFEYNLVGTVGFLVERSYPYHAYIKPVRTLSDTPARTNLGGRPLRMGWCGETDNISTYAWGVAAVVQVFANGRARVRTLHGAEALVALAKLGWPDLGEGE